MNAEARAGLSRFTSAEGLYACLAISVVCAAWEGEILGELAFEVVIYAVALWLFHIYADILRGGWATRGLRDLTSTAKHQWPHLEAGAPALLVVLIGRIAGWSPAATADLALAATIANLLMWQIVLLRPHRPSLTAMIVLLVLDTVVAVALISLRLLVK